MKRKILIYSAKLKPFKSNMVCSPSFSLMHIIYWSLCVVFRCFGHLQTIFLQYLYLFPQAFEANASSSGGIQTLIDEYTNQDIKITTIESESYTCKRAKVKFLTPTFKQTIPRRWLLKKVLDHPDFHSSPTAAPPSMLSIFNLMESINI